MDCIVSFDGPKATGKTTLIGAVLRRLREEGKTAEVLVEKDAIPPALKEQLRTLYAQYRAAPGPATDQAIADTLRAGRQAISEQRLAGASGIILLDRWYPSDAVFRRHLDPDVVIAANLVAKVTVPDLCIALVCDPALSWRRAHERDRSLDSKVIADYAGHRLTSLRFGAAARKAGWLVMASDHTGPEVLADGVCRAIAQHAR